MTYKTTLPTQTIGSLGSEKTNRTPVLNPYLDDDASEVNEANTSIEELFERVGLAITTDTGSYQYRIDTLVSNMSASSAPYMLYKNAFTGSSGSNWTDWPNGGTNYPISCGTAGGGIKFPSDNNYEITWPGGYAFSGSDTISIQCRVRVNGTVGSAAPVIQLRNAAGTEAIGVALDFINDIVSAYTLEAGAPVGLQSIGSWTAGTEFLVKMLVTGSTYYASLDDDAYTTVGSIPAGDIQHTIKLQGKNTGTAGHYIRMRMLRVETNWENSETDG